MYYFTFWFSPLVRQDIGKKYGARDIAYTQVYPQSTLSCAGDTIRKPSPHDDCSEAHVHHDFSE